MNPRLAFYRDRLRNPGDFLAVTLTTFFGAGLLPVAPGTWGSLFALPVLYFTVEWDRPLQFGFWCLVFIASVVAAKRHDELMDTADNQRIVIDEVLGMAISTAWITQDSPLWTWCLAFGLFRFFDITKLPPVRTLDRLSKNSTSYMRGFAVIADDLIAGVQAAVVGYLIALGISYLGVS